MKGATEAQKREGICLKANSMIHGCVRQKLVLLVDSQEDSSHKATSSEKVGLGVPTLWLCTAYLVLTSGWEQSPS